jgi:hypothetical protein
MTRRRRVPILLLAWLAIASSLAVGLAPRSVRAGPLLLLPSPLPSIGLPSPLPSIGLPSIGLPSPLPSIGLPSPLPSIGLPSPLPSIGVGTPLPSIPVGGSTSPAPSGTGPSSAPSESPSSSAPAAGQAAGSPGPSAGSDRRAAGGPGGAEVTNGAVTVPEAAPLPPSLPDLGSWLVPALGVAVPILVVAGLVALQLIGGAAALRIVHASLDRVGSRVPPWLKPDGRAAGDGPG